jgi:hypothetical protein
MYLFATREGKEWKLMGRPLCVRRKKDREGGKGPIGGGRCLRSGCGVRGAWGRERSMSVATATSDPTIWGRHARGRSALGGPYNCFVELIIIYELSQALYLDC